MILNGTQRAAGTGMVLTANGEVLTNRHVVSGETAIAVTIPATGRTYDAHVVGIAPNTDVAVVQLEGASGLDTVKTASGTVSLGDEVVGVGNAGGTGGTPSAAPGQVTGLGSSITATDEDGSNPEDLTGLIQTDADIEPGDSGGPLLNTSNAVVGMDTAGSSEGGDGYAIPIATALDAAKQIEANPSGSAQSGRARAARARAGGAAARAGPGRARRRRVRPTWASRSRTGRRAPRWRAWSTVHPPPRPVSPPATPSPRWPASPSAPSRTSRR